MGTVRATIGIKRMGELDVKQFLSTCRQKIGKDEAESHAALYCSQWQEELRKPSWHPFKVITIEGKCKVWNNCMIWYWRGRYWLVIRGKSNTTLRFQIQFPVS